MQLPGNKGLLKKLASVLLMFGIVTGAGNLRAEQGNKLMAGTGSNDHKASAAISSSFLTKTADLEAPKTVVANPALAAPSSEDEKAIERKRRADIRDALLGQARADFVRLAPLASTGYAHQLEDLQKGVNDYLKRNPSFNNRAVILKPDEFDAAMAIGMGPKDALKEMLKNQGVDASPEMISAISRHMNYGYDSKFGLSGYTQDAETQPNVGTGADKAYVIIPNSNHADTNPVPGLSYQDNIEFFNRHETWHAKDSWYDMTRFSPAAQAASIQWDPAALDGSLEARQAFSMQVRKEALGDVAAAGDMIRADAHRTTALIDTVATWRQTDPFDVQHLDAPVLQGLKTEIDKMGVAAFRRMDEQAVKSFYHDVVERYGINDKSVRRALDYDAADPAAQLNMAQQRDPDTQKGVAFAKMKNADPAPEDSDIPLTPDQQRSKSALNKYNPAADLEARAFKLHGKITPATFIEAYGQLEEELRQKAIKSPDNPLYTLQMTKMQETFVDLVRHTDYVAINKRHNVTIEEQEPSLSRFTGAGATTGAPPENAPPPASAAPEGQPSAKKIAPKTVTPG